MEDAIADAHQRDDRKQPIRIGGECGEHGAAGEQSKPTEQHRPRAEAIDGEARGELRDAARAVEHAHQQPEQRPRHVEFDAQQREQRRQRELEEMRERVGDPDEADDADVAAERIRDVVPPDDACGVLPRRGRP